MTISTFLPRLSACLLLATACLSQADAPPRPSVRPFVHAGLSFGGDTLATAKFDNDNKTDIKAGQLAQIGAGLIWQPPGSQLAVAATANYQIDGTTARHGKAQFTRIPYELIAYFTGIERLRIGIGARRVHSAEVVYHTEDGDDRMNFKHTTGRIVEVGYLIGHNIWINMRGVDESYELETYRNAMGNFVINANGKKYDAEQIGVNVSYEF